MPVSVVKLWVAWTVLALTLRAQWTEPNLCKHICFQDYCHLRYLVDRYRCFGGICCLHLQSTFYGVTGQRKVIFILTAL
jgi:hypothetical protein